MGAGLACACIVPLIWLLGTPTATACAVLAFGVAAWSYAEPALRVRQGVIAGLVAQYASGPDGPLSLFDCARIGVYAHGLAADRWRDAHADGGLLAEDLLRLLPGAVASLR